MVYIVSMTERNPGNKKYKIDHKKKVFVYKNLHKDCWSVKQDGLVKAHTDKINLWDCAFRVNARGRQKVLDEQRKNVHAGINGYIDEFDLDLPNTVEVTYNPYKYDSFVDKATESPIYSMDNAKLTHNKVTAYTA